MSHKKIKKVKKMKKVIKRNPYQKRKHVIKRKAKKTKKIKIDKTEVRKYNKVGKDGLPKRPRGRPRKDTSYTLNAPTLNVNDGISITGKKRGRPKNTQSTEYKRAEPVVITKPMKVLKFAGYCPACQLTLTTQDVDNNIFTCYKCNKSDKVENLLSSIPKRETAKNKKEYLQTVNSTTYEDMYASNKPVKDDVEEKTKEVEETTDATEPIDPIEQADKEDEMLEGVEEVEGIDPTEEIDLEDPIDPNVIKTDEELTIEKHLKNYLDKDDNE